MATEPEVTTPPNHLRRYMKLEYAVNLLKTGMLAFPSPEKWPDRNDVFALELYKQHTKHEAVRVCCFGSIKDTFHHWKVFTPVEGGVCFIFKYPELSKSLLRARDVSLKPMTYLKVPELQKKRGMIDPEHLPFLKWERYRDEREHRALWRSAKPLADEKCHEVQIDLACIEAVEISPLIQPEQVRQYRDRLERHCVGPAAHVKIKISTTTESPPWKNAIKNALRP
jgi:hypothetical protein